MMTKSNTTLQDVLIDRICSRAYYLAKKHLPDRWAIIDAVEYYVDDKLVKMIVSYDENKVILVTRDVMTDFIDGSLESTKIQELIHLFPGKVFNIILQNNRMKDKLINFIADTTSNEEFWFRANQIPDRIISKKEKKNIFKQLQHFSHDS